MYIPLELIGILATHIALFLACWAYAAFLGQPHIYRAYHPHHTIWTVVGGELLVGVAFAIACVVADGWIRTAPLIAFVLFGSLQCAAAIPIWRWQRKQATEEKARETAIEARLAAEEREHGN